MAVTVGISNKFLKHIDISNVGNVCIIGNGIKDTNDIDFFLQKNIKVTAFDYVSAHIKDSNYTFISGDFNKNCQNHYNSFDVVWACHVLEHQRNVGLFLDNVYNILKDDGVLCVCVPPLKHNIVGGHVSLWNMGILMYNLVLAKFDVKNGKFKKSGYNIFGMCHKNSHPLPNLIFDKGDIEALHDHWNDCAKFRQNSNGDIDSANWESNV